MRIALVCEHFTPARGGSAQWSSQVARRLARRGHELRVLTFAADDVVAGDARDGGIAIRRLPWHPSRIERARAIAAAVDATVADVVHDTGAGWSCDVFQPQTGTRLANYRRDMASRTPRERLLERSSPRHWRWLRELYRVERRQFARSDALFVAVSTMVAASMQELYGVPRERIRIVANGVDLARPVAPSPGAGRGETRRRLGVVDDETLFLFPAHNPRLKGVRPLLAAARVLRDRQVRFKLALIGHQPDADLRRRIAELGLDGTALACGFVDDATAHYAAADAVVLPSYYDACSLTVFEACASGLPVLTTRHNGASEHVTDGREGFVVDAPDDLATLAQRLHELTDASVRERMSAAAAQLARRHDLERNVDALEAVLHEAAAERRRRGATAPRRVRAAECRA